MTSTHASSGSAVESSVRWNKPGLADVHAVEVLEVGAPEPVHAREPALRRRPVDALDLHRLARARLDRAVEEDVQRARVVVQERRPRRGRGSRPRRPPRRPAISRSSSRRRAWSGSSSSAVRPAGVPQATAIEARRESRPRPPPPPSRHASASASSSSSGTAGGRGTARRAARRARARSGSRRRRRRRRSSPASSRAPPAHAAAGGPARDQRARARRRSSPPPSAPRCRSRRRRPAARPAAPTRNWITPSSADAVPATSAWSASASAVELGSTKDRLDTMTNIGDQHGAHAQPAGRRPRRAASRRGDGDRGQPAAQQPRRPEAADEPRVDLAARDQPEPVDGEQRRCRAAARRRRCPGARTTSRRCRRTARRRPGRPRARGRRTSGRAAGARIVASVAAQALRGCGAPAAASRAGRA